MNLQFGDYVISTDKSLLVQQTIYDLLSRTYWANQRTEEQMGKAAQNSLCFGVYHGSKQIGFARVITDYATAYWLCDVVIDEAYRGKGIGKKLVECVIQHDDLKSLSGFLGTADAHQLYEQYGFMKEAERFMVRRPQ